MTEQPLEDLLVRLERERLDADRRYNDALTAVNHAIQRVPSLPASPPPADEFNLTVLNARWRIGAEGAPAPEGSWRGRLRAVVWSLVAPMFARQEQFNAALVDHLNRNAEAARALPASTTAVVDALREALEGLHRFQSLLVQFLMTITAFVDTRDRRLGAEGIADQLRFVEQRLFSLGRAMDRLEAGRRGDAPAGTGTTPPGATPPPDVFAAPAASVTYVGFEDRFRGTRDDIRRRVEDYLPLLIGASNVVDVGCGRGEMLEALRQHGVSAKGVDANHAMVELCRARGLDVAQGDALAFLQRQPDGSVGGLVAIQVVEHFTPAYLSAFLAAAHDALAPGAPLVLETINPACWAAYFDTFIRDLTHQRPLHPETLKYLVEASGFGGADVQFRQPVREHDRLARIRTQAGAADPADPAVRAAIDAVNDHADKLNARLFSAFDYVVIARR